MKRPDPAAVIALAVVACFCIGTVHRTAAADNRPNIILCMADDQGYGDVGYMGNELIQTPVLDEMARTGLRMNHFYAAAPVCSPTRGSVLTGRHPNRFGCFAWGYELRPQEITIAEALKSAGYTTGHFGKWHVGPVDKFGPNSPATSGFDEFLSAPNYFDNDAAMSHNGKVIQTEGESSMVTVDAALSFIEKANKQGKPFLAVVWFGSPHDPHRASDEIAKLYADQPKNKMNYLGEITGIDRAMGKLRKRLREMKIADDTIVWYTSDNGPRPIGSTAGLRGWKGQIWDGGIRVPTIIEWPARIRAPRQSNLPSGTVDIYPTVCAIAGVTASKQVKPLDGQSLLPVINDKKLTARDKPLGFWAWPHRGRPVWADRFLKELAAEQAKGNHDARQPQSPAREVPATYPLDAAPGHAAWIDGDYKLHRIEKGGKVTIHLYNLAKDPAEANDLAETDPARTKRLREALEDWQRSVIRSYNGEDYAAK